MTLFGKRIKNLVLGLAVCSSLALAAPLSATHAAPAHFQHPFSYPCPNYHGSYWGYSYGYYNGGYVMSILDSRQGYNGYNYGSVWYRGYYPNSWYWNFYNSWPTTTVSQLGNVQYRCFAPQIQAQQTQFAPQGQ
jgi:hypothetical protein